MRVSLGVEGALSENARLIASQILLDAFDDLNMSYPKTTEVGRCELLTIRKGLEKKIAGGPLSHRSACSVAFIDRLCVTF